MIWPGVSDERLIELRSRGIDARPQIEWRTSGTFLSLLFFVLTATAVGAAYGFLDLIRMPGAATITGLAAIALAELLIQRHRFFGTGVESALWLGGVLALIFGLPGEGRPEALLLFAAGSALAGIRVRNALFGALAMVFVSRMRSSNTHRSPQRSPAAERRPWRCTRSASNGSGRRPKSCGSRF